MRSLTAFLLLFLFNCSLFGKEIPVTQAKEYATAAFELYSGKTFSKKSKAIIDYKVKATNSSLPNYYAFNMRDGGFIILSANDEYSPVLGFSDHGHIDFSHSQENIGLWGELSRHEIRINELRQQEYKAPQKAINEWNTIKQLSTTGIVKKNITFTPIIGPLTTTLWNQDGYYNSSCPSDADGPDGCTYCGCLPIAISMLLKYYENPAPGNGFVSYNDPIYGLQEVDLCGQQFDYASMPDTLSQENKVLADFIYDVGKSMYTFYSTSYTATYVSRTVNALIYNYGFDQDMKDYRGTNQETYSKVLKTEFDEGRIVFLSGWSIDSLDRGVIGHTWLADGYGYSASGVEYMHFNWGWGGSNNGWFLDTPGNWEPYETNPEQATIPYYWYRYSVYNIKPSGANCTPPNTQISIADPQDDYAYLYYRSPIDELSRYRYKHINDDEWITTEATENEHMFVNDLDPGETYEFQVARNCCGEWSPFTSSTEFTTLGTPESTEEESDCIAEAANGLFITSLSDKFAFVYTTQPYGNVANQFRYKISGTDTWIESAENPNHYLGLSNLASGTNYEYQVRHECEEGIWSPYSESFSFTTTGDQIPQENTADEQEEEMQNEEVEDETNSPTETDCPTIELANFEVGYATASGATAYLLRLSGGQNYQYRYRIQGTSEWILTESTAATAVNFTNLRSNSNYEVQVAHHCGNGWSEFSESKVIQTLMGN
jgi:hypothetical protein